MFAFFEWYIISVGHFPQKSLSGNTKIDFPLLPTAKPHPLLPKTRGPPLLYWLGTSKWCLSLVHTSLPYESITFLPFMHLPLPTNFFDSATRSGACLNLVAWMSPHTLYLISSLG